MIWRIVWALLAVLAMAACGASPTTTAEPAAAPASGGKPTLVFVDSLG